MAGVWVAPTFGTRSVTARLAETGSIASIVGLGVTILTFLSIWMLQKTYRQKTRLPILLVDLNKNVIELDAILNLGKDNFYLNRTALHKEALDLAGAARAIIPHAPLRLKWRTFMDWKWLRSNSRPHNFHMAQVLRSRARSLHTDISNTLADSEARL